MSQDEVGRLEAEVLDRDEQVAALVEEIEHLRKAMESRATIEQAKGVLMATMRIGPDAAFSVLVAASQRENRKLREIAERLVAAQELPDPSGSGPGGSSPAVGRCAQHAGQQLGPRVSDGGRSDT